MRILGINAFHGDSSAALFEDGQLVAAIEEERLNRVKHWAGFPAAAIRTCLDQAGCDSVDAIAISRDPRAHLGRKILRAALSPSLWPSLGSRVNNNVRIAKLQDHFAPAGLRSLERAPLHNVEHHRAHLASAFFASPFEEAAVISIDGFGDFSSVMWGVGRGNQIEVRGSVQFPHSLGLFYTAFTQFLGFPNYGDEYKMMGLSAYGEPRFYSQVREVVRTDGGQCALDLSYFVHHTRGVPMTWENGPPEIGCVYSPRMIDVFGMPRLPRTEILPKHADLAASVQKVLEDNYFELLRYVAAQTGQKAVCLAGGVALNCVANGMVFDHTPFQDVYVQPAAHDAGTSIGAALYVQHQVLKQPRSFHMRHVYYGPEYSDCDIQEALDEKGLEFHRLDDRDLIDRTAREIAAGKIVGWFQGRMEFGPRALGGRSILADPRNAAMKDTLNSRIKYREPFRPFCPSILAERVGEYFETDYPAPFMVAAYKIKPHQQARIPAVTHGDGTGRLQTVEQSVNPLYWQLIKRFDELTGVPVLLNTSFNENEPIVNTPEQAIDCFLRTQMDTLSIGSYLLCKSENLGAAEGRLSYAAAVSKSR